MKRFITLAVLVGIGSSAFAAAPTSNANKSSSMVSSLGSAWKSYRSLQPKNQKNDIEMVYGGEDVKNPALVQTAQS